MKGRQKIQQFFSKSHDDSQSVVITRPSATSFFGVDSTSRYISLSPAERVFNQQSPYDFEISRTNNLINGFFNRLALTEIVFPYYIPNVNRSTNCLNFTNITTDTNHTFVINPGFYSPVELALAVQTALRNVAFGIPGATCVYLPKGISNSAFPNAFLIETNNGDEIQFFRTEQHDTFTDTSLSQFQLYDMMGMNGASSDSIAFRTTRCRPIEYIDIVCSQLTYNQELKDTSTNPYTRDVIARIYIETETEAVNTYWDNADETANVPNNPAGTYPFTIYRQFSNPKQIKWDNKMPLGNIKFELYDNFGNILNPHLYSISTDPTGSQGADQMPDWRFTLLVSED